MKIFLCMKWGTRYGPEYVNRLAQMIQAHTSGQLRQDYQIICITDDPSGICDAVDCKPMAHLALPAHLHQKPWLKLLVWAQDLYGLSGDALFLDVDLVVTGSLDDFFTYQPGEFCVIENWTEPGKRTGNTSVFRFPIGKFPELLENFKADIPGIYAKYKIEQRYITREINAPIHFWPRAWCRSFKQEILPPLPQRWWQTPKLPADAKIVVFHGKPDPDEALRGEWPTKPGQWYKKIYKTVRPTPWIGEHWG